jgi:hypothetical protein
MSLEQNENENKQKIITCFIHYNDTDDLSKTFDILHDFRTRYGLKYSHNRGYIFFTLLSDHLEELSKVRPFKVSKFQTRSEYSCSKEVIDKLMKQRDSFIRVKWNDDENKIIFISRMVSRIHTKLIKRIFKDSDQEFDYNSYKIIKSENDETNTEANTEGNNEINTTEKVDDFTIVENKKLKFSKVRGQNVKNKTKYEPKNKIEKESSSPKIRGQKINVSAI